MDIEPLGRRSDPGKTIRADIMPHGRVRRNYSFVVLSREGGILASDSVRQVHFSRYSIIVLVSKGKGLCVFFHRKLVTFS